MSDLDGNRWLELGRLIDERIHRAMGKAARVVRGTLVAASAGTGRLLGQALLRAAEAVPSLEIAQHWGFASVPPPGTEIITVPVGGSSQHRVVVAEIDPARPSDLVPGESALYGALARVVCRLDGSVEISTPAGVSLTISAAGAVQLAGGGAAVARVGDSVAIEGTDSLGGPITIVKAEISTGSSLVQAGG